MHGELQGTQAEISRLEDQVAASKWEALAEAEIDRLAAADEEGRVEGEEGETGATPITDAGWCSGQWPAENGSPFPAGMQVTGIHRVAAAFPPMEETTYDGMVESIRIHGLRQPIILASSGLLIDGVNRLQACGEAGVQPVFATLPDSYDEEAIIR